MGTVARLKEGEFLLAGTLNERVPSVRDGMVAHYPFDGTAKKYVPSRIRYIRDYVSGGSTANGTNHWIELQAFDENGVNVALNKTATNSLGASIPNWVDGNTAHGQWSLAGMSSGTYHTVDLGDLYYIEKIKHWHYWGDPRTYHNTKVAVSVDGETWYTVFDSAIEGEYVETSNGHEIDLLNPGATIVPSTNTNTTQTDDYIAIEEATTNIIPVNYNWSKNANVTYVKEGDEYVITQPSYGDNGAFFGAFTGSTAIGDSYAASFDIFSPYPDGTTINVKIDTNGGSSNAQTTTVTLKQGKHRYWVGMKATAIAGTDVRLVFYPRDKLRLSKIQLEKKGFATSYTEGSRGTGRVDIPFQLTPPYAINLWHKPKKPLAQIIDQPTSPMIFQLGNYYGNASVSFWNYVKSLVVYVKGNASTGWTSTKNYKTYTDATWDGKEHMYTLVAVDNRTFRVYMDGEYLGEQVSSEDVTAITFLSMGNTSQPNAEYRDLTLYNRVLTDDEVIKLYKPSFSVTESGDLFINDIQEKINGVPADSIYLPLSFNSYDRLELLKPSSEANLIYDDKGVFVGQSTTNQAPNPAGKINPRPYTDATWDAALHADALRVDIWSTGINAGVPSPGVGYHAKWVYEGIDGSTDPCMKFIDRNDQFGLGHRWLGISGTLGTPTALGWTVGTVVTVSWYQKADVLGKGANPGLYHKSIASGNYTFNGAIATINVSNINKWERVSFSFTVDSDWDLTASCSLYVYGNTGAYGTLWVDNIQIEKRNFLKPFTENSQPQGELEFNLNRDYGLDWSQDWSIVYWKKPMGTANDNLTGYNIDSLGSNGNTVGGGYVWWGKASSSNTIDKSVPLAITPEAYFGKWRMVSLVKSGSTITIKEWAKDGTVHVRTQTTTTTVANYYVNQYGYDFKLAGWDNANACNAYYRDLVIAKRAFTDDELNTLRNAQLRTRPHELSVRRQIIEKVIL